MPEDWSDKIVVVDLSDEPALSDELAALLERLDDQQHPPHVVLNFSGVSYINSSNIAQLLRLHKRLAASERSLKLCSLSQDVWSVLTVTGLDRLFRFAPDPMTALAGIQLEEEQRSTDD